MFASIDVQHDWTVSATPAMDGRQRSELPAPLQAAEHRSRSREQGAHVRRQGCRSSRRRAIGEKRKAVAATRRRCNRPARRSGFAYFRRNESRSRAARKPCFEGCHAKRGSVSPGLVAGMARSYRWLRAAPTAGTSTRLGHSRPYARTSNGGSLFLAATFFSVTYSGKPSRPYGGGASPRIRGSR